MTEYQAKLSFTLPLTEEQAAFAFRLLDACKTAILNWDGDPSTLNTIYDNNELVPADLVDHVKRIDPCSIGDPGIIVSYEEMGSLWIRHDRSANLPFLLAYLKEIMRAYEDVEPRGFEWCCDCSGPHVGAFGGGAAMVSKDDSVDLSTHDLLPILDGMLAERRAK